MAPDPTLVQRLQETIAAEVSRAAGMARDGWGPRLVAPLVTRATRRFARLTAWFDDDVRAAGMCQATRRFLPPFIAGCRQSGADCVPREGPVLIVANHIGASDALVIAAGAERADLQITLSDIPVVRALPHMSQQAILVPPEANGRAQVVRDIIARLHAGKSVLIFPTGNVTPDPEWVPNPAVVFENWSRSSELILRRVPEAQLIVAIVSGVLHPRFLHHPLVYLRRLAWRRQILAEFLQVLHQLVRRTTLGLVPRVTFGAPLEVAALGRQDLHAAILERAAEVMYQHVSLREAAHPVPLGPGHEGR